MPLDAIISALGQTRKHSYIAAMSPRWRGADLAHKLGLERIVIAGSLYLAGPVLALQEGVEQQAN